jgi:hypothetical protein
VDLDGVEEEKRRALVWGGRWSRLKVLKFEAMMNAI